MTEGNPPALDLSRYDFIDVGANKGHSYEFARTALGCTRGLAVDINARQVRRLNAEGIDAIVADCRALQLPPAIFQFGIMSHVLEHLDNLGDVTSVIANIARVCRDAIVIRQPWFDEVAYLSTLGLKSVGANLTIHPIHLTMQNFVEVLRAADLRDYAIFGAERMHDSRHRSGWIVDARAPADTKGWKKDPEFRPAEITFDRPMFQELYVILRLSGDDAALRAVDAIPARQLLVKSAWRHAPLPD